MPKKPPAPPANKTPKGPRKPTLSVKVVRGLARLHGLVTDELIKTLIETKDRDDARHAKNWIADFEQWFNNKKAKA